LAAVGTTKANAVTLNTYSFSGTFGDASYVKPAEPDYEIPDVVSGSFDGTFTVDVEQLPVTTYGRSVDIESRDVRLRNSSGAIVADFSTYAPSSVLYDTVRFGADAGYSSLSLFVENGSFIPSAFDVGLETPVYGVYERVNDKYSPFKGVYVTSFSIKPVPEPLTFGGTVVAGAMGLWLKHKK
jgi:hypothetical protein